MSLQKSKPLHAASKRQDTAAGRDVQEPWGGIHSDGRGSKTIDARIGKANAFIVRFLRLWSQNGILTYGHESWVMSD